MTRPLARGLATLVLILALATPALAEEVLEGDGYRLAVPAGFTRLPASECGT